MTLEDMQRCAPKALALLKTMANEKRLFILCNLTQGELSVNELAEKIQLSQSALSQHLAILRQEGYVNTRKESQTVFYSIRGEDTKQMLDLLQRLYG